MPLPGGKQHAAVCRVFSGTVRPGQEVEVCTMLIECCAQERTYLRFYGLLAERFCLIDRAYQACSTSS